MMCDEVSDEATHLLGTYKLTYIFFQVVCTWFHGSTKRLGVESADIIDHLSHIEKASAKYNYLELTGTAGYPDGLIWFLSI